MMSLRRFMLCAIGGSFFVSQLTAAVEWHVIKINGRDFLSVDNIAKFGGFDKGAISGYGYEKDYALDLARLLRPLLQAKGFRVVMTRESDVFVPLELRARIANATSDSIFVSLHFNATDRDPLATGFEIYSLTPRGAPSTYEDGLT